MRQIARSIIGQNIIWKRGSLNGCSCVGSAAAGAYNLRRPLPQRRFNSNESSRPSKLPIQLPSTGAVNLTNYRGLLALHGIDAAKFLQGLITKIFPSETEHDGLFTAFLSPQVSTLEWCLTIKGRVLFDVFIYTTTPSLAGIDSTDSSPVYIIDIEKSL